jgi:hypothetical protein
MESEVCCPIERKAPELLVLLNDGKGASLGKRD